MTTKMAATPPLGGREAVQAAAKNSEKRMHIIREIRQSEESYVEKLNLIVTLFWGPLHVNPILDKSEMDAIFSNITELRRINLELLSTLREHRSNPGQAFTRLAPFLKFYALYAENFNRAVSTLQECVQRNAEFAGFKLSQERRPVCQALKLEGFLIMPVQRIPRYRLLLKDLLRHTEDTHPDYSMLKTSYDQICEVATHINEYIRQHENFQKMLSIQQGLSGAGDYRILMPGRKFLREGRLMKLCRKKCKERVIFLFSDQLVYAKPRTRLQGARKEINAGSYVFRAALPLVSCSVTTLSHHIRVPDVTPLLLVECQSSSLILFSATAGEVEVWAKVLQDAIRELQRVHESVVDLIHRRNSRSLILTNTMVKGTRLVNGDSSNEQIPLLHDGETSDYPLRYSVMSDQPEDVEDDEDPMSAVSLPAKQELLDDPRTIAGLDLHATQDVDDLLRALAFIDSNERDSGAEDDGIVMSSSLPLPPPSSKPTYPAHDCHMYASVQKPPAGSVVQRPSHGTSGNGPNASSTASTGDRTTRPLSRPLEKFSRDGVVSQLLVAPAAGRLQAQSSNRLSGTLPAQPQQQQQEQQQQARLSGQGPSFRRRPPTNEMREKYQRDSANRPRDHDIDDSSERRGHIVASSSDAPTAATETRRRERLVPRWSDRHGEVQTLPRPAMPVAQTHTVDRTDPAPAAAEDDVTASRYGDIGVVASGESKHPVPPPQSHPRDQPTSSRKRSQTSGGYVDDNGIYRVTSSPDTEDDMVLTPHSEDHTGTLRKKKQERPMSTPRRVVTLDNGQLTFADGEHPRGHNPAIGGGHGNTTAMRHDDSLVAEPRETDQLIRSSPDMRSSSPGNATKDTAVEEIGSEGQRSEGDPPGDDPVTELGCGGLRTTTYSFETASAQSRLCVIL